MNLKSLITIYIFFLIGKDTKKCILVKTGHPMANPKHTRGIQQAPIGKKTKGRGVQKTHPPSSMAQPLKKVN